MLYCNDCGQCVHISNDSFIEYLNTSGWEEAYLHPVTGETIDYGEHETTDSNHDRYECPHCQSSDIDFEAQPSIRDAQLLRESYGREEDNRQRAIQLSILKDTIEDSEWDLSSNEVHEVLVEG